MITFNHSGGIGDILFSLYFCKDLMEASGENKFNFNIQINVKDLDLAIQNHPFGGVRMNEESANFLKPLLEYQDFINEITISDVCPQNAINLDYFRRLRLNFGSGDIRNWYYNLATNHLKKEFWKPNIKVNSDETYKDKILFCLTARYYNVFIDYKQLKEFSDNFVFIGFEKEHDEFEKKYFKIDYYKPINLKEAAEKIQGAKGFVGNQSGLYTVAECIKSKRILIGPEFVTYNNSVMPGPHNNHPIGGWCEDVSTTEKMIASIKEMLK